MKRWYFVIRGEFLAVDQSNEETVRSLIQDKIRLEDVEIDLEEEE
jgi:hypothetical protein